MYECIKKLKDKQNYEPDIIFDIGAHHGLWTDNVLKIYNQSKYYLFEAIDYGELNKFRNTEQFSVNNVILNEKEEIVDWYEMRNTGDSMFKELNKPFENCQSIKKNSTTLDIFFQNENFEHKKIFIKIDCQGAEIPILKGATNILKNVDFIILELPFFGQYNQGVPDFCEHIQFMKSIGFIVFDFLESHYIHDFTMQADILFIRQNHPLNIKVQKLLKA